jgi:tetratricopeptide (TPR) repeat protein
MARALPLLLALMLGGLAACSPARQTTGPASADPPRARATEAPARIPTPPVRPYQPGTDPRAEAALAEAVELFEEAAFEEAALRFTALADDGSAPIPIRADALRYLGRVQVALGETAAAQQTMARLIALEPPIIELDPDHEPPPLMLTYYEARRDHDGNYAVRTNRPQTLAIVNFTNSSITDHASWDPMQQGFASLMIHAMGGATDLKLIERERIRWLLDEHDLQRDPSLIDQATAVRAGRLLGAQTVVFGSFIVNRRDMFLSARLVDVETGEILLSEQVRGRADAFDQLIQGLSLQLARALNVQMAGAEVETRSLDAALAYSEGLALIERGDYRGAQARFMRALEYDPSYSRARVRAQSLSPMLASR